MNIVKTTLLAAGALVCLGPSAYASLPAPNRPIKIAIIVGNNRGISQEKPLRYARSDAKKLAQTLQQLGGYSATDIHLLLGQSASTLKHKLQQIALRLKQLKQTQPHRQTMFLFYYSGHADGRTLHLGASKLGFQWLRNWLKRSPAQVRLAILDTCQSGQIIRTKGARRVNKEVPLPPVIRNTTTRGMALITSSGVGEDSHELDQLRSSVFTHYLVSGLRGAADRDRDGRVTLREAYSYAYQRTISHTVFLSNGVQHPSFRNELLGHGHLVLTRPQRASARILFEKQLQGTYFILNRAHNQLLAELKKQPGKNMEIGLEPGKYTIVRRASNGYQTRSIKLTTGQTLRLKQQKMVALSYSWSASKGMKWLTRDLRSPISIPSGYRTAMFTGLGIAAAGLVTSGVLFGLTANGIERNRTALTKSGQFDPAITRETDAYNAGAIAAISVTGAAAVSSLIFYLVHRHHVTQKKQTIARTLPPRHTKRPQKAALRLLSIR